MYDWNDIKLFSALKFMIVFLLLQILSQEKSAGLQKIVSPWPIFILLNS